MNTNPRSAFRSFTLAAGLLTAGGLAAAATYPDGVILSSGLTVSALEADGWTIVYQVPYAHTTTTAEIDSWRALAGPNYAFVFLGAVDNAGNIIVGATGLASEVLTQTSSTSVASAYSSSNLFWYNRPNSSIGFTPTSNISLSSADITGIYTPDDGYNLLRLSWHISGGGGWRAGALANLNDAITPEKIVLVKQDPQGDGDGDGVSNESDNCPLVPNVDQADADGDAVGDVCDTCPFDPANDEDDDNICDDVDACPHDPANDADGDGLCANVDPCPVDPANDADQDGVCGNVDNCPTVPNPDQVDTDGGGTGYTVTRLVDTPIENPDTLGGDRSLSNCDDCATFVSFEGRTFTMYGDTFDGVLVTSNGSLEFPTGAHVLGLAADLYPPANPSGYRANLLADRFVGTWRDIPSCCSPFNPHATFQITLRFETGTIELNYDLVEGIGAYVGIGLSYDTPGGVGFDSMPVGASQGFGPFAPVQEYFGNASVMAHSRFRFDSGDGMGDACDPCPSDPLNDVDADGLCGIVDNCPFTSNVDQTDSDDDGIGDVCDPCPVDVGNDADTDGRCESADNCPNAYNPDQGDGDADGRGDACDNCFAAPNPAQQDVDHDEDGDACDNCPASYNPDQYDFDSDGRGDVCDNCGVRYNPDQLDTDHDLRGNACDNCDAIPNPDQSDLDADDRGDACDNCLAAYNPYQDDFDLDARGNACDNCYFDYNPAQSDLNHDGEGDLCDVDDGLIYLFSNDPDYIEWQSETGPTSWNLYTGDLAVLKATAVYTQLAGSNPSADRFCGLSNPWQADFGAPPPGSVKFSLVTGATFGVEGSLGNDSAGAPRMNLNPCP